MISKKQYDLLKRMSVQRFDLKCECDKRTIEAIDGLVRLGYAVYVPFIEETEHALYDYDRYAEITSLGVAAKEARDEKLFMFYIPLIANSILSLLAIGVSIWSLCQQSQM